jgi:hypothetical protein
MCATRLLVAESPQRRVWSARQRAPARKLAVQPRPAARA